MFFFSERALQFTKDVEPAMEWLLAHADEEMPALPVVNVQPIPGSTEATNEITPMATSPSDDAPAAAETSSETPAEAKSLKCDECNRLFKNQTEVEFHAAKSGHSSFSESTEEKKPLTETEKKAQLALLEERLKQKRIEREEKEKLEALEKEKSRIRSGKDMLEAKARMEELEMKKIMDQRKREKEDEKRARDRVRAQIESDKAARKARMAAEAGLPVIPPVVVAAAPVATSSSPKSPVEYSKTKIQIRLQDGTSVTETFEVKEQLSAVRLFIQLRQGDVPFGLMTSFPRKVFAAEDYEKPLEQLGNLVFFFVLNNFFIYIFFLLGLVPSAVVIVTKAQ